MAGGELPFLLPYCDSVMRNGVQTHWRPVHDHQISNKEDRDERAERADHPGKPRRDSPPPACRVDADWFTGQRFAPQRICLNRIVIPSAYGGGRALSRNRLNPEQLRVSATARTH